jgi:hypothetical protein
MNYSESTRLPDHNPKSDSALKISVLILKKDTHLNSNYFYLNFFSKKKKIFTVLHLAKHSTQKELSKSLLLIKSTVLLDEITTGLQLI